MGTRARPDARSAATRPHMSLTTALNTAQAVLVGSGAALLGLGLIMWTGRADEFIPLHLLIGLVLVLSLWTIAAIAARAGVSGRVVGTAVGWSLLAAVIGTTQQTLLSGDLHWIIEVLHLVVGMGVIGWGRILVVLTRRTAL